MTQVQTKRVKQRSWIVLGTPSSIREIRHQALERANDGDKIQRFGGPLTKYMSNTQSCPRCECHIIVSFAYPDAWYT